MTYRPIIFPHQENNTINNVDMDVYRFIIIYYLLDEWNQIVSHFLLLSKTILIIVVFKLKLIGLNLLELIKKN